MAVSQEYLDFILDQLEEFGSVETKRMFGGVGIFKEGLMFAKIGGDTFRLKVDDTNKEDFVAKGMKPFFSEKKKKGMPYWEVPVEVIEDKSILAEWANKSYSAAKTASKK
jgi:DNA transformation protein